MKVIRVFFGGFLFAVVFSVAIFAQAQVPAKIAIVDTDAFYDPTLGITKIINAYKSLETEFRPSQTELDNGAKRLQTLQTDIQALQNRASDPNNKVPIDQNAARAKVDEFEKLQRDLKFRQEEAKATYGKREAAVIGPIIDDVGKALGDFAKQKGYTLVLDIGKLFDQRLVIYWEPTPDITKEFVLFYNAKPAGTAVSKP